MKFNFDYKEYRKYEENISRVEEKAINDSFEEMTAGNSSFEEWSSVQIKDAHWIFRHGWICRSLLDVKEKPKVDPPVEYVNPYKPCPGTVCPSCKDADHVTYYEDDGRGDFHYHCIICNKYWSVDGPDS